MSPHSIRPKTQWIQSLFDKIANRYDSINFFLSLGLHLKWKRDLINSLGDLSQKSVLDVATGTGDLALMCASAGAKVVGLDISQKMLEIANRKDKNDQVKWIHSDIQNLSSTNEEFDFVLCSFGVRNFENPQQGILYMWSKLKPKGVMGIMEFGSWNKLKLFPTLLEWIAINILKADSIAYRHLVLSSNSFECGKEFSDKYLNKIGFVKSLVYEKKYFGIFYIYLITKE